MKTIAIAFVAACTQAAEIFMANEASDVSAMQGVYSDPNHPGCPRFLSVHSDTTGSMYGTDDCETLRDWWGPLPITINGYDILVDFSSKGGPSDLPGTYSIEDGSSTGTITWDDGNMWSQLI